MSHRKTSRWKMIGWLAINSITIRVGQALIKAQFRTVRLTISTLLGVILSLRWQKFGFFFDHLPTIWNFLPCKSWPKSCHFWTIYPPYLVNVVKECPLRASKTRTRALINDLLLVVITGNYSPKAKLWPHPSSPLSLNLDIKA